ncbi:anti-dorsalizing morphogenic protein isoform X2 [Oncorhynchus tshawytscha]|uniref:anti-dorsalizing morphogenic protein isoform X2 n=1 Tax=Oncorhynchus tshawytscha TaxID=74940 RepID=UPI000D0A1573|nr:anti-dorsalizing morphogenic protein isoform X2 [Oncorhynchus tshawytscha]
MLQGPTTRRMYHYFISEMLPVAMIIAIATLVSMATARSSLNDLESHFSMENESEEVRSAAIRRLLEVFGMEGAPLLRGDKQPPQYMVDLYNTVADVDGVTKDPYILEGNTVRSFFDKLHSEQIEFLFNLSMVASSEKVLTAELHLFKLRPQVSVYQLLDSSKMNITQGKKLLSSRLIPVPSTGWEVFTITQAVRSWMAVEGNNLGLLVTVQTLGGSQMDEKVVRFSSGRNHHKSKQPMLVLFTDDGRRAAALDNTVKDPNETPAVPGLSNLPNTPGFHRSARSLDYDEDVEKMTCQRLPLYVDFEEIGWSGWIVSPRGYNAYHCKGSCPFPLGQNMRPTNHATVQSIINALKLTKGIETPCCAPDKLFSINLLYFDDDENVVLKQYDDMVAGSCGCH